MQHRYFSLALIFCTWLTISVTTAQAAFINLGDSLAYDDTHNRVWYTGSDRGGTMDQIDSVLDSMDTSVKISGRRARLDWTWASQADINTITFTNVDTLAAFNVILAEQWDRHFFRGYVSDNYVNEYGDSEHLSTLRGVYRLSETEIDWWDDYTHGGHADHYDPFPYARGNFWLVANIRNLHAITVSEPPILLILSGLLGVVLYRRRG